MFYVYVLKSRRLDWIYIGSCGDLARRVSQHNSGKTRSTKFYKPFDLVYYEAYETNSLARKREYQLKHHAQEKELLLKRLNL